MIANHDLRFGRSWTVYLIAAIAVHCAGLTHSASGCSVCIGFPEKTDADYLLEANCVVLARASADDPFTYAPLETLKGQYDGSKIDLLVDSKTRRTLRAHPDRSVLLVQRTRGGVWRSLGNVSPEYVAVARRTVMLLSNVDKPMNARQRWEFFLPLFGHEEPRVHELAYLEMARAPYQVIKRLAGAASREDWMPMLTDSQYLQWRSLAILMLAQSERPQDQKRVVDAFRSVHRFQMTTNLAAWAAAAIEVDSEAAIGFIEESYFRRATTTSAELDAIATALSMHSSQPDPVLRARIAESYRVLLKHHPQFASLVASNTPKETAFAPQ